MIDNFALIIGAMRCGTTSLFYYLAQHPQISACTMKEPNFFASDDNWANGFDWYQGLWDWDPLNHTVALEGSTHYTKIPWHPNAAARIATTRAKFKFIYIMRNPLDQIESQYKYARLHGFMKRPIQDMLPYLIGVAKYATQIEEYYKRFPAQTILLLDFEDLKEHPLGLVETVCGFLGIDPSCDFKGVGETHNPYRSGSINHPMWDLLRHLRPLKSISKFVPARQKNAIRHFLARKAEARFTLSAEQRDYVLQQLRGELHKLTVRYGFDVSKWGIVTG